MTPQEMKALLEKAAKRPWNSTDGACIYTERDSLDESLTIPVYVRGRGGRSEAISTASAIAAVLNRADLLVELWAECLEHAKDTAAFDRILKRLAEKP